MTRLLFHLAILATLALSAHSAIAESEPFDYVKWREFWSFKPVSKPQPPQVKNKTWERNAIDAFILAKLEAQGLSPAPQADKHTLIRRATFDLTGLPPTLAEIEAFIKDTAPDAYEKLITRLLASPHYGERYGRHWLDVVRYEQGKVKLPGIKNTRGELDFRDYIIRSFNSDKPYNQLILEHLAGDLLPETENREQYFDQLTATAFLSIGNWFDECTDPNRLKLDIIDEQINAVSKAFLGLTISCARCHDHKFDPITERDYYALAGIFASTRIIETFNENWKDGRIRLTREKVMPDEASVLLHKRLLNEQRRADLWAAIIRQQEQLERAWTINHAKHQLALAQLPRLEMNTIEAGQFSGQSNLKLTTLEINGKRIEVLESQTPGEQWVKYEVNAASAGAYEFEALYASHEPTPLNVQLGGETIHRDMLRLDTLGTDWSHRRWGALGMLELKQGLNTIRLETSAKDGTFPRIGQIRWRLIDAKRDQQIAKIADQSGLNRSRLAWLDRDPQIPTPSPMDALAFLDPQTVLELQQRIDQLNRQQDEIRMYERFIAVRDMDRVIDLPIHIGGDTYRVSKATEPRAVPVLFAHAVKPSQMDANRSGRLELAQWLTDPKHPLTARVMVNRLWQYHFGHGIVDSPNDFGSRGSTPSHPQLLDWLAATFIEQGWSMKKMHYLIMTSATYRQASRGVSAPLSSDAKEAAGRTRPGSRELFSPFPRRRLEVEAIYDAMLATTGKVPRQPEGQPLDFNKSADRMMFVLTANRSPVGLGGEIRKMFAVFDYDPSGEPIGKRDTSTTAAQSLFWLNNPIPKYFAGEFARQSLRETRFNDAELLRRLSLTALGREPEEAMLAMLLEHLNTCEKQGVSREAAWTQVCLAIYASNEFRYLD